jgi:mRNA interferase MazF
LKRGDIYEAILDPVEGSEQGGSRPVVIFSRNAINAASPVVVVIPCTTYRPGRRIYPTQILLQAGDGGLRVDSIALGEQIRAIAKTRLKTRWGSLSGESLRRLERAIVITLDLPGQNTV